jgi:hypothetical protein
MALRNHDYLLSQIPLHHVYRTWPSDSQIFFRWLAIGLPGSAVSPLFKRVEAVLILVSRDPFRSSTCPSVLDPKVPQSQAWIMKTEIRISFQLDFNQYQARWIIRAHREWQRSAAGLLNMDPDLHCLHPGAHRFQPYISWYFCENLSRQAQNRVLNLPPADPTRFEQFYIDLSAFDRGVWPKKNPPLEEDAFPNCLQEFQ